MKLIILRGLPGCGKSTIAEKLSKKFDSKVIYGDSFKLECLKRNNNFKEACEYSYEKIFEEVKKYFNQKEEILIIEELFFDKDLVEKIKDFCKENNIKIFWFYIQKDLEKLLEIENKRERSKKNTTEDFKNIQKDLDSIKNEGEIIVDNNGSLEDSINFILKSLENKYDFPCTSRNNVLSL